MQWCQRRRININRQKTQVILFENNKKSSKFEIIVNGSVLKQVKEKKILRIIVDEKLTFKSHIEYICTKARKSYGHIAAISMLSPANYVTIYKSFIRSHLKYCCAAWNHRVYHNSNLKLLESAQRGALSLILRLFKSTPTVALEAELGILLIYITGIPCSEVMEIRHVWCLLL